MSRRDLLRGFSPWGMLIACLLLVSSGPSVAAPPSPAPSQAPAAPVTAQEKAQVRSAIEAFYKAWVAKDLDRILLLEKEAIETSALDYEKRGKGKAQDVRESFRGCTNDLLTSKEFQMKPLNLADVEFRRHGEWIVVSSVIPIIATESVEIGDPGSGQRARIVISKLVFRKSPEGYRIIKMDLHD